MDIKLFRWINGHHSPFLDKLLWAVGASGELYLIWWVSGVVAYVFDREKGRRVLAGIFVSLLISYISVDLLIKPLVARPRPFAALESVRYLSPSAPGRVVRSNFSFPSGHCASSAAAACVIGWFYRRFRLPLLVFVILMGYSRVYVGVHYPLDCLAGYAVGAICGFLSLRACGLVWNKREKNRS